MVGIVSYGAYIPKYRIRPAEIGRVWGINGEAYGKSLNINSKSVPAPDEDTATISTEAAKAAMNRVNIKSSEIGAVYVGSESHPYAVKPTATIVAEALDITPYMTAADLEFACKAGTAAIQISMGLVKSKMYNYCMAIGSDTSQGSPGDPLEYSASAGGAAFIIGDEHVIADINYTCSYTTDTPDFWRREGQKYPRHGGRFTGEPAYFKHIIACSNMVFKHQNTKPEDYNYVVLHQPNGKFPYRAAKMLGFRDEQITVGLLTPYIGNTYSGAVMLGTSAVLDIAKPGDRIFVIGFGSGAGCDGFDITVTEEINSFHKEKAPSVKWLVERSVYIDYSIYAKFRNKIILGDG
ncbi:MAG: hydroxymethylglutaryl-CoA synthase [Candidatus Thermoplasmatota archaeon]|jgi:hydroxymethylglutaryl-CoA synthase|nr:hydroxymethylglutaryl-CoA synthase [Candidatus Thermoplasmatota archaeon]MCL5962792.1 hydroxymethylglutaryl-CoA synthase [Candidatus Thermoplasmatota archaeon]